MYNLHVENKKTRTKQNDYKKWQKQLIVEKKSIQFTNETSTETSYRPQFGFRQAEKKTTKKTYFSPQSQDFKKEKQRNPLKRAVI